MKQVTKLLLQVVLLILWQHRYQMFYRYGKKSAWTFCANHIHAYLTAFTGVYSIMKAGAYVQTNSARCSCVAGINSKIFISH